LTQAAVDLMNRMNPMGESMYHWRHRHPSRYTYRWKPSDRCSTSLTKPSLFSFQIAVLSATPGKHS